MKSPLISICIPTYNGEKYLKECLNSVISQTYENLEIIIVDDISTDGTVEIINEYLKIDSRIQIYKNEFHLGLVGNWNKCLKIAKGDWIKFVFQDDFLINNCVEILMNAANNSSFVVCDRNFIFDDKVSDEAKTYYNEKLLTLHKLINTNQNIYLSDRVSSKLIASNSSLNFIGEPTVVMFKKNVIDEIGYFNPGLSQICDLEYWLRIITLHGFIYVPQTLASFRIHILSTTSKNIPSGKNTKPIFRDIIILSHELLYSDLFAHFRKLIGWGKRKKLIYYLNVKLYELRLAYKNEEDKHSIINDLFLKYPALKKHYNPSIITKLLYRILLIKRK